MTSKFETVEIPFVKLPDGREFISARDVAENPWLERFVQGFSNWYTQSVELDGWVSPMPGTPSDPEEASFARLTGSFKHYCPEWDYMAIDETWLEFEVCSCYEPHVYAETAPLRAAALEEVRLAGRAFEPDRIEGDGGDL